MRIYYFLVFLLLLGACSDDSPEPEGEAVRTVIVYLGVDNNFKGEDHEKIADLAEGWKSSFNGHLLVYADNGDEPYLTEIYSRKGKGASRVVKRYPDSNSADPEVFRQVLTEIINDYPAQSYGLVLLSHATGWLPENTLTMTRSVINDKGREMEVRDMVNAIPVKMEFVVFDACFMGGIEIAYEFKDKTDYFVASPAEVLVPGFVYTTMMDHLMAPEPDLVAVAREFYKYYDNQSGMARSATVSVVRTDRLEELAAISQDILKGVDGQTKVDLNAIQSFGYGRSLLFFDFGDYIQKLAPERYDEFMMYLDKCLIYKAATPGYYSAGTYSYQKIRSYSGLAVYVPQTAYPFLNSEYLKLKWVQKVN